MSASNMKWIQSPYFATGNPETEEMTTLYAPGMLGCCAQFDQGGISGPPNVCEYQLVKQYTAIQGVVGSVFTWQTKSSYTVTNAALSGNVAGIGEIAAGTAASYIWILKKGDRSVLFVDAPASAPSTAGKPVVASDTTAGKADCLALSETQAAFPVLGTTLSTQDGTSKLATVRVNIPDRY